MYLIFDVETTGKPKKYDAPPDDLSNWPRMVQIAWIKYDKDGGEIEHGGCIIRPDGFTIPDDATEVHGITTEIAMKDGVPLKDALNGFLASVDESNLLVSHNISFDENVVLSELIRENFDHSNFKNKPKVCTMKDSTRFCQIPGYYGEYKWPKLSELYYKLFGIDITNAHTAIGDTKACADCFFKLKEMGIITI